MINLSNTKHWLIEQVEDLKNNSTAIIYDNSIISYPDLLTLSKRTASYLVNSGVKNNQNVAIVSQNNLEYIIIINALWLIGAKPVPLNPNLHTIELNDLVNYADCSVLINVKNTLKDTTKILIDIINFNVKQIKEIKELNEFKAFDNEAICLMMFTSGSTGKPKCVNITFSNLFHSAKSTDSIIKHKNEDQWLASLPFYHIGGFSIITRAILAGCSISISNSLKNKDFLKTIKRNKPNYLSLVPKMFNSLTSELSSPWKELKQLFLGGGPINFTNDKILQLKKWPISIVYGSTETCSMVSICSSSNLYSYGVSAGLPMKGVDISINEDKRIVIHSKSIAHSYYKGNHELNLRLSKNVFISNDLGEIDSNGNLIVFGRDDRIIISGGENISLNEIESLVKNRFSNIDFLVKGITNKKWDQSYVIILESGKVGIENEIRKYLEENISRLKMPYQIIKINKIPRNDLGKLQLNELAINFNLDFL